MPWYAQDQLLIDLGNSSIKWAILDHGRLQGAKHAAYFDVGLETVLKKHWTNTEAPAGVVVSSVGAQQTNAILQEWLLLHWGMQADFVASTERACGVVNGYDEPTQLGVDRWLAILAAFNLHKRVVCVVSCGTAVTLDTVTADGHHLGGYILPGLHLMYQALAENTAIPKISADAGIGLFGRDTQTAIRLGARHAIASLIERTVEKISNQLKSDPIIILTGGDADEIGKFLNIPYEQIPYLVLEGIQIFLECESL